jgi:hypothetical protein
MTQQAEVPEGQPYAQPPPGWPYGDPPQSSSRPPAPPRAPEPPRRVPRKAWYLIGTGLIVLGFVVMVVLIGVAVTQGLRVFSDAVDVRVPGTSQVDLPAGKERMLWVRPGDSRTCTATDTSGRALHVDMGVSVSVDINGDEWDGLGTFPTGDGHVLLTCNGADGVVRVGHVFGGWGFFGSIVGAILAPFVFGFAGTAVLTVTGVRHYRSAKSMRTS